MTAQAASPDTSALSREEEQAEVIRRLEEDIIFGRFAPGSRLVEDTLMGRYGASRHFGGRRCSSSSAKAAAREKYRRSYDSIPPRKCARSTRSETLTRRPR
jgi:hypothetical protein